MSAIVPTSVTHNKTANTIVIAWSDGRTCTYPVEPLRLACPCVECRGGHEKMGQHNDPSSLNELVPTQDYRVERLEIVGHYALQPIWNDGHDTGIYTWNYLYKLCPAEDL